MWIRASGGSTETSRNAPDFLEATERFPLSFVDEHAKKRYKNIKLSITLIPMSLCIPEPFQKLYPSEALTIHNFYATSRNFTAQPITGYSVGELWLHKDAHTSFMKIVHIAQSMGLSIVVWDAYRPYSATKEMVQWAISSDKAWLVEEGYIARRSRHNGGVAVDLGLMKNGKYLDMGTEWDDFSEKSHIFNVTGQQLQNRMLLQGMMRAQGWVGYTKEWWHFELQNAARYPAHDIRYIQSQEESR